MFRRSRFSVRPNVGTAGRTAATPQDAPPVKQEASETPRDASESRTTTPVTGNKSGVTPAEKPAAQRDGNDQNGEGPSCSAAVQRRKRFFVKPKVAPGRLSAFPRTPKSPVKSVSETPVEAADSDLSKPTTTNQTAAPQGLRSPRRRRPSEESKQPKVKTKSSPVPPEGCGPSAAPPAEEQTHLPVAGGSRLERASGSPVKEVPSGLPDKAPSSLPKKEAIEISEKAKTLMSSKSRLSMSPAALSLSRLLNDPSDLQRLAKTRKLRDLIKEEMHKEKKIKKAKLQAKEFTLDPAKMTMRDLIHYLPVSNPMTSSLEEPAPENESVVPPSPVREESPETAQEPEAPPQISSPREAEEEEAEEEEQEEALLVPQVKVAEDGSLIIDEHSLTVEVLRAKGPNPAEDRDPIFERGSTTTYSSFRKLAYSRPWFNEETDMFFLAISMVGTDFSMICQLFPHRARSEIKNKFKKEERVNPWRVDKAFRERRKLDIEYFSKLLEKILEVHKNRKKLKSLAEKNTPKKRKRTTKDKKASMKNGMTDLEEEDEDLCHEEESPAPKPDKKRKRNIRKEGEEEPNDKKNKLGQQDEASIPEDAEAALPEDRANADMSGGAENANAAKGKVIKPAKLPRGRAAKKKPPPPPSEARDAASDEGGAGEQDGASEEPVNIDASPGRQINERKSPDDDVSSEDEGAAVPPLKPTRYGRMPKPTKLLTYPAEDDPQSSASETTATDRRPKPKCATERRGWSKARPGSKKPKLVTLRASQSDDSDEEREKQWEEEEVEEEQPACSSGQDGMAPAFVPASLRSPHPLFPDVEETMEELDILVNMPDVLGISHDALCPDVSCKLAHSEPGSAEPCEHEKELLVDVLDFFSSENTEVTDDDRYNEAAQTLLTIGTLAESSQSVQNQTATPEHPTEKTSALAEETSQRLEEEVVPKPAAQEGNGVTPFTPAASGRGDAETVAAVELQASTADTGDAIVSEASDLQARPEKSEEKSSQTRRGRLPKVKPKPNLGRASRAAQSKSQPEASAGTTVEEGHTVASNLHQATDSLVDENVSKGSDSSQKLSLDEVSSIEVKRTEKPSGSRECSDQLKSGAVLSYQDTSEIQSQRFSLATLQPVLEQATRDATRESTDERRTSDVVVTEFQGSNINSALVQQSSDHPVQCEPPVEDIPVGKKEEGEATTRQVKNSQSQKVKPNLALTSRGLRPITTRDASEKNANSAPNPKVDEKPTRDIDADAAQRKPPAKPSQIAAPVSDLTPSLDVSSTLTPTEALSSAKEPKSDDGDVCQTESGALISNKGTPEKQNFSETQYEPSREQAPGDTRSTSDSTEEKLVSSGGVTESRCNNLLTSDSVVPETMGRGCKRESEVASTCQIRRGQKVKPKPNLPHASRNVRSRPQTTKETFEKDPNPEFHNKTTVNLEACITSPEKCTNTDAVSDAMPSLLAVGSTIASIEGLSTIDDTQTDVEVLAQAESGTAVSDQSHAEDQNISETQFDPSRELVGRETTSESSEERLVPHTGLTESPSSGVPLTQVGPGSSLDSAPVQESSDPSVQCEARIEQLPVSHRGGSEVPSTGQTRRGQKIKPKPNLPQMSRSMRSRPQTAKDTVEKNSDPPQNPKCPSPKKASQSSGTDSDLIPSMNAGSAPTATGEERMDVRGAGQLESLQSQPPHRNVSHSQPDPSREQATKDTRPTHESMDSIAEVWSVCSATPAGNPSRPKSIDTASELAPSLELRSTPKATAEPTTTGGQKMDVGCAPDLRSEGSEQTDLQRRQRFSRVKPSLRTSTRNARTKPSKPSELFSSDTTSKQDVVGNDAQTQDPNDSTLQPCSSNESEAQSHDARQCSETTENNQIPSRSTADGEPDPTGSPKSSKKPPQVRRGRLGKPKPNLERSRPPKPVPNNQQAEAGRSETQEPLEGAVGHNATPNDAGSSLSSAQVPEYSSQHGSTSSTGRIQTFSDKLLDREPPDADEPFFILSLTEITISSLVEVEQSAPGFPPGLPAADASEADVDLVSDSSTCAPLSCVPGEAAVGDGHASGMSTGVSTIKDPGLHRAADAGSIVENPADPHESDAVKPSRLPETVTDSDEAERPPAEKRFKGAGGSAKPRVEAKTQRREQAGETHTATEVEPIPTQEAELPGPLDDVIADAQKGSSDHVRGNDDDGNSGGQTTQADGATGRIRRPSGFTSSETNGSAPSSGPPPAEGPMVETTPSASRQATPTPAPAQPSEETQQTPSEQTSENSLLLFSDESLNASLAAAAFSTFQPVEGVESSSVEEEPISMTQYFLSDIFTDVEEG